MASYRKQSSSGDPNCPVCNGRGAVDVDPSNDPDYTPYLRIGKPARVCDCVAVKLIQHNLERGMSGLSQAPKIPRSGLLEHTEESLWITADPDVFKAHLRHVAARQGHDWMFLVKSDLDLITAWLGSVALKRTEIFDADVAAGNASQSLEYHALLDLVLPPQLLVVFLGVKASRNSAMPEVLLETLTSRDHKNLPTWVVDQPHCPLDSTHLAYSEAVYGFLRSSFKRIKLGGQNMPAVHGAPRIDDTMRSPLSVAPIAANTSGFTLSGTVSQGSVAPPTAVPAKESRYMSGTPTEAPPNPTPTPGPKGLRKSGSSLKVNKPLGSRKS